MLFQKLDILLLETSHAMVLGLVPDVFNHLRLSRLLTLKAP